MKLVRGIACVALTSLCACAGVVDKTNDYGFDSGALPNLSAGIWIDPNGCDHWIIDDGIEGYLSQRLDPQGKPVCSGTAPAGVATGPFKSGSGWNGLI